MNELIGAPHAQARGDSTDEVYRTPKTRQGMRAHPRDERRQGISVRQPGTEGIGTGIRRGRSRQARRAAWSLAACTALCLLIPRPAFADATGGTSIPDSGVPVPAIALAPSSAPSTVPVAAAPAGPLAEQILTQQANLEATGERLTKATEDLATAQQAVTTTNAAWQSATAKLTDLQQKAGNAASQAYKDATSLGPFGNYVNQMHQLGMLAPGFADSTPGGPAGSQAAAQEMEQAQHEVDNDYAAYQTALTLAAKRQADVASLSASRDQQQTALDQLKQNNAGQLAAADALQQQQDLALAGQYGAGTQVNGMAASPTALAAVAAAKTRLGDPYVWGAQGPSTFDCSGLVYWSYHQANYWKLPRVAADQYHATTPIPVTDLLPGDLVFFSTTSKTDWTQISHVGMYVGGGYMIEAPTTGDVVKIAPVWWSAFFGATRVVGAVPAPAPSPTHSNSPTPSPTASKPSPTPGPSSKSPSPTPTASTTPSSTPTSSSPSSSSSSSAPTPTGTHASASPSTATSKSTSPSAKSTASASASASG